MPRAVGYRPDGKRKSPGTVPLPPADVEALKLLAWDPRQPPSVRIAARTLLARTPEVMKALRAKRRARLAVIYAATRSRAHARVRDGDGRPERKGRVVRRYV